MLGVVTNQTHKATTSSPDVVGICFSTTGQPLASASTYTSDEAIPPGGTSPFSSQVYGDTPSCPIWLVGSVGSNY
jgi:hypothetical protein